ILGEFWKGFKLLSLSFIFIPTLSLACNLGVSFHEVQFCTMPFLFPQ
ncbi:hypothetical protein Leryth_013856, partial [Lithospermum erythrorhizon]